MEDKVVTELRLALGRDLTKTEEWLIRIAYIRGKKHGIQESSLMFKSIETDN